MSLMSNNLIIISDAASCMIQIQTSCMPEKYYVYSFLWIHSRHVKREKDTKVVNVVKEKLVGSIIYVFLSFYMCRMNLQK